MEGRPVKRLLSFLFVAACCVLYAAFILWFWPVILHDMATGEWQRQRAKVRRINKLYERFSFERWFRKENETRHKRVWKNRNNFYK
jgi:hypothetical protein